MNTRRNTCRRVEKVAVGENQAPPQAPAIGVQEPVNPAVLIDGEVRAAVVQISQANTGQTQSITAQATREGSPREKPHANTMASRLRDFTRINPPVYIGSRTNEDP